MTRPTMIILGGSDKHADFTPLAKCMCESGMMAGAVLIGVTAPQIEKALLAEGFNHLEHASSMEEAVRICQEKAQDGWNVLLSPACASFDMFHDYEERGRIFKEIVHHLA